MFLKAQRLQKPFGMLKLELRVSKIVRFLSFFNVDLGKNNISRCDLDSAHIFSLKILWIAEILDFCADREYLSVFVLVSTNLA